MQKVILAIAFAAALTACGNKEVAFDTLEQARKQARENGQWNAEKWRADAPPYSDVTIVGQGDSTQKEDCPQGDGWATMDLYRDKVKIAQLKCSTVSQSVGCLLAADFKTKSYATDDGKCQPTNKVPFPLPKVGGK